MNIFPNPTKGLITVNGANFNLDKVMIISLTGQTISNFNILNESTLNLQNLNDGVYFLKINETVKRIVLIK